MHKIKTALVSAKTGSEVETALRGAGFNIARKVVDGYGDLLIWVGPAPAPTLYVQCHRNGGWSLRDRKGRRF